MPSAVEQLKVWLRIAVWTSAGAVVGAVLAYLLFGFAWTNWDAITGEVAKPASTRGGDPIDNWAKGYVAMMMAVPVVLTGTIAGALAGARLGRRRHQKKRGSHVSTGMILGFVLTLSGCDPTPPAKIRVTGQDEDYNVTHDMLVGATFTSRTGKDRSYDDLQWRFQDKTFLVTAGRNGLPRGLASRLLPDGVDATEISGKWTVDDRVITFTEITADGELTDQPPRTLRTMVTPILRIEAGQQYKFSRQSTRHASPKGTTESGAD